MRRLLSLLVLLLAWPLSAQVTGRGYSGASPNTNSGNIGVPCRTVSGSSDSGGIVTTDRAACIEYTATGAVSETLPQAGTAGFGFNFPVKLISAPTSGSQTVTVTITTSTATVVNGYSVALSQTSFQLTTGQFASVNSPDNTNYFVTITTGGSGGGGVNTCGSSGTFIAIFASTTTVECSALLIDSNGNLIFPPPSGISYGTVTQYDLATVTATGTIGNCTATPCSNLLGVFTTSTGGVQQAGFGKVNLDGTVSVTDGDTLCASASSADTAHDYGTAQCPSNQPFIGTVTITASSVTQTPAIFAISRSGVTLVNGFLDGDVPVTITTGTTATLGAGTYQSGYTENQEGTAGTGVTYTLPATVKGMQYCVQNSGTTGVVNVGVLTVYPPASSYVILNGVVNTVGGGGTHGVASGGAAADAACFIAIDSTHWQVWVGSGTWTEN